MNGNRGAISALVLSIGACSLATPERMAGKAPAQEPVTAESVNALESLWGEQKLIQMASW